jgi:hypothetical protein
MPVPASVFCVPRPSASSSGGGRTSSGVSGQRTAHRRDSRRGAMARCAARRRMNDERLDELAAAAVGASIDCSDGVELPGRVGFRLPGADRVRASRRSRRAHPVDLEGAREAKGLRLHEVGSKRGVDQAGRGRGRTLEGPRAPVVPDRALVGIKPPAPDELLYSEVVINDNLDELTRSSDAALDQLLDAIERYGRREALAGVGSPSGSVNGAGPVDGLITSEGVIGDEISRHSVSSS